MRIGRSQNVLILQSRLCVSQLGCIKYIIAKAISQENAQIKVFISECIIDTAIKFRIRITNNSLVFLCYFIVFATVYILKFPHTGFHIGFIACIRNAIFQCVSLGGCIIIKIRHLIQAFCNITVHLPQRLVYTDNMCVLAISEISFPKLHFFSRQLFYRIFIVR